MHWILIFGIVSSAWNTGASSSFATQGFKTQAACEQAAATFLRVATVERMLSSQKLIAFCTPEGQQ